MASRSVTSGVLGALAVVAGWAAWSALAPRDAPALPATVAMDAPTPVAVPAAAPPPAVHASAMVVTAPATPATPAPLPPLRDGLAMVHGMPMAVRTPASDDGAPPALAPTVALPPGARAEDASVNQVGMVSLNRRAASPAVVDDATANAARPATITRSP